MTKSKVSLKEWVIAIYLISVNLKGVSSMKFNRDLERTQKTAWLLAQGFIGGKVCNMKRSKRATIKGTGHINKQAVFGAVERVGKHLTYKELIANVS